MDLGERVCSPKGGSMRALLFLLLAGCLDKPDSSDPGTLLWYSTCGDPVCSGYSGPFDGVPACETEVIGEGCETEAATCDPVNDCNALLICATEDPTAQEGGCPISLRSAKKGIHYLSVDERGALSESLLSTRLARYHYNSQHESTPQRLGFIIDDQPGSPAVLPDGAHVDLYGYTSMAVATIQQQQAEIAALKAELAELRARTEALEAARAP